MFFLKKRRIKNKIRDLEIRIDVISRLMRLNIAKVGSNKDKLTPYHYENDILNQEKIELEMEVNRLNNMLNS
jgi:hypothetical protein